MNKAEFYRSVKDHWWKFAIDGWRNLTLEGNDGTKALLSIEFEADGDLSFPSEIPYLPTMRHWDWNETTNTILLLDGYYGLDKTLLPPVRENQDLVIQDARTKDRWVSANVFETIIRHTWAPDPLIKDLGTFSRLMHPFMVVDKQLPIDEYESLVQELAIASIQVQRSSYQLGNIQLWEELHQELLDQAEKSPIAVLNGRVKMREPFYVRLKTNKLTLLTSQHAEVVGVMGHRSLMTEFVGELLFEWRLNQLNQQSQSVNRLCLTILERYFKGRYVNRKEKAIKGEFNRESQFNF
ncbi:hypothetical protein [Levilactobacillus bambusae]|uniref:Uncharacterized protein n=1 Tax=Levilactobacillus bambusae TaxID=2024736 RepID=A0A2V1MXX8_9LACO|nr:hypothetical protein [Levilactobacillus bambusae]PWF99642.1 hypothetical protein DCM90_07440 [Levilactobacillus bambusae]